MRDELDITKNIRLTEFLKADIIGSTAELYKRMAVNADSRDVTEAVADVVLKAYLLADTLGITYSAVDRKAAELLTRNEDGLGEHIDLAPLLRHFSASKDKGSKK